MPSLLAMLLMKKLLFLLFVETIFLMDQNPVMLLNTCLIRVWEEIMLEFMELLDLSLITSTKQYIS